MQSIDGIPCLSKECKEMAKAAATTQVRNSVGPNQPLRVKETPLPTGRAYEVLQQGHY